jgi:ectoine hydroxylase-related dioxygenase (phytanoyl-CoA dioxygenase family)
MRIIPRTHNSGKMGFSDYEDLTKEVAVFPNEITATQRDMSKVIPIELEANQCSLHDGRLIHGSEANTSTKRRCGYTMRYISTRTRENHEKIGEWHHLYLARGKDLSGNVYGDPTKAYPELARFRAKHGKNGH